MRKNSYISVIIRERDSESRFLKYKSREAMLRIR